MVAPNYKTWLILAQKQHSFFAVCDDATAKHVVTKPHLAYTSVFFQKSPVIFVACRHQLNRNVSLNTIKQWVG